jgi:hypothetical protein
MSGREFRHDRQRALDQLDRAFLPSALMGDDAEQVQRIGMIGNLLQHFAVQRFGAVPPSRLIVRVCGVQIVRCLGAPPLRLLLFEGCHSGKTPNRRWSNGSTDRAALGKQS